MGILHIYIEICGCCCSNYCMIDDNKDEAEV